MMQFEFLKTWISARFVKTDRGASLVEYALLVALIAVACITAVTLLGSNASDKLSEVSDELG
jgi:pilus assembly protein Flp/PilA